MKHLARFFIVIGVLFALAAIVGTSVRGMNFHVVFADDKTALQFHEDVAKRLKDRIENDANINHD